MKIGVWSDRGKRDELEWGRRGDYRQTCIM